MSKKSVGKKKSQPDRRDFPDTRWSIVVNAADLNSPKRTSALESLIESYLPALRAHLILKRRLQSDRVEDFVQEFVLKKILEQNVVAKADSDRGKFRSFILKALDNFVRDYFRTNKKMDQLGEFDEEVASDKNSETPNVFEAAWARQVFCNAVSRFKDDCDDSGNKTRWILFRERLLVPIVSGNRTGDYGELAEKCNFENPKQARNAMVGVKRGFDRALQAVIKDYVLDESLVAAELNDLYLILKNSNVLDDAIAEFVPLKEELNLTEECFQSIRLASIIEMNSNTKVWTDHELAKMWSEILNSSFEKLNLGEACRRIDPTLNPAESRVRDVLFAPEPSLKMLDLLRSYAKAEYGETGGIEDFPCYFVLYMVSIAAAAYKHQETLSRLPLEQLKNNFNWVLKFNWLDNMSHEYLEIARRVV